MHIIEAQELKHKLKIAHNLVDSCTLHRPMSSSNEEFHFLMNYPFNLFTYFLFLFTFIIEQILISKVTQ